MSGSPGLWVHVNPPVCQDVRVSYDKDLCRSISESGVVQGDVETGAGRTGPRRGALRDKEVVVFVPPWGVPLVGRRFLGIH